MVTSSRNPLDLDADVSILFCVVMADLFGNDVALREWAAKGDARFIDPRQFIGAAGENRGQAEQEIIDSVSERLGRDGYDLEKVTFALGPVLAALSNEGWTREWIATWCTAKNADFGMKSVLSTAITTGIDDEHLDRAIGSFEERVNMLRQLMIYANDFRVNRFLEYLASPEPRFGHMTPLEVLTGIEFAEIEGTFRFCQDD